MSKVEYLAALKLGRKEIQARTASEEPTALPALDAILEDAQIRGETPLGLIDVPTERIVGTKTRGRQMTFAPNFMPIMEEGSEFAMKWSNLCDAHLSEGIRDPLIAYEYLNKYYILEGNKRASVLKYFDAPSIPAYVTRLVPAWKDEPEIRKYYEFLDFYNDTNINYIDFSREGGYRALIHFTGHTRHVRWPMEDCIDFRSCYHLFSQAFADLGGEKLSGTVGDAFLIYAHIFGYEEMKQAVSPAEFKKNLKTIWEEVELNQGNEAVEQKIDMKLDPTPDKEKLIPLILTGSSASEKETNIAFLHNKSRETSSWTYAHELGRMHVQDVFHNKVHTTAYENISPADAEDAIEEAIAAGNTILFTTTPLFLTASIKAAAEHPEVKILNCSLNTSHKYIRTYYARLYEAKLLSGMLAGIMTDTDKIGYIADYPIAGMAANINAFALGVQMVNPRAKVHLEWSTLRENEGVDLTVKLCDLGANYISHLDMIVPAHATRQIGLYRVTGEAPVNLALPVLDWGKYYERLVRNIQHGTWNTEGKSDAKKAISYFWGMSSGVVDVAWSASIPPATRNMLESLKQSISRYDFNPFRGILTAQGGIVQDNPAARLSTKDIIAMDWLCDNIVGFIPTAADLSPAYRDVVFQEGIRREEDA